MNPRRVAVLLGKELAHGPRNYIFIFAIIAPIAISLVVTLVLGNLFSEEPRLGITDEGSSRIVVMARELDSVSVQEYSTVAALKGAVENGAVDMGIVLPEGFDAAVLQGESVEIDAFIWGESLARNRTLLPATFANLVRDLAGQEVPIEIESVTLGNGVSIPWSDRLLPFIVLATVFLGGLLLPATSVIEEKQKKTLVALIVTPASLGDVFAAKGLVGIILSLVMGVAILLLNRAFGAEPLLLVLVLALGAVMAVELGLLCGAFIRDITTLFTLWKSAGIVLFAPVFIYLFPQIPQWIGKIFPTYYILQPIVDISQRGAGWPEIALNVSILVALDIVLAGIVVLAARKTIQRVIA